MQVPLHRRLLDVVETDRVRGAAVRAGLDAPLLVVPLIPVLKRIPTQRQEPHREHRLSSRRRRKGPWENEGTFPSLDGRHA
eukprot:scaffold1305_cov248-Pinguiococcus_pyrenoidosus.AAC.7